MTGTLTVSPAGMLAAGLIRLYQRFISPYKGFACAYRVKKKRCSCSEFGRRVAMRFGLLTLPELLSRRFRKCSLAAKVLDYEPKRQRTSSTTYSQGCTDTLKEGAAECALQGGIELACGVCDGI